MVARRRTRPRRNPTIAERSSSREVTYRETDRYGDAWEVKPSKWKTTVTPPRLTRGHMRDPATAEATIVARHVLDRSFRLSNGEYGDTRLLGSGNFGIAYLVDSDSGPRVVKVSTAMSIHQRPWTRAEQVRNLMHEAGVANELGRKHLSIIPKTVYTHFDGGTPALVREYGEPVTSLTGAEYGALEAQLLNVERKYGWHVEDELALYRRADGSVFVGDVGFWRAPSKGKRRPWRDMDSSLKHLLEAAQKTYGAPNVTSLPRLLSIAAFMTPRRAEKTPDDWDAELAQEYIDAVADRAKEGVPTPRWLAPVAARARLILRRYGKPARRRR